MIPPEMIELLQTGVSMVVRTRDAGLMPECTRAWGIVVGKDRASATIAAAAHRSAQRSLRCTGELDQELRVQLRALAQIKGRTLQWLSEVSILTLTNGPGTEVRHDRIYTLLHDNGFSTTASLFKPQSKRLPDDDRLTVSHRLIGSYPNAFYHVAQRNFMNSSQRSSGSGVRQIIESSPSVLPCAAPIRTSGRTAIQSTRSIAGSTPSEQDRSTPTGWRIDNEAEVPRSHGRTLVCCSGRDLL